MSAEAMSRATAAAYLDMSVRTFDEVVRPFVPCVRLATPTAKRPALRWLRTDLDAYLAERRRAA